MTQQVEVVPVEVRSDLPPPMEPAPPEGAANPLMVAHALLRGRYLWAIPLALCLGVLGAFAAYKLAPLKYQSAALIRIKPNLPRIIYQSEQSAVMPMFDAFVQSQVSLIQDQRVIDMAMQAPEWKAIGRGLDPQTISDFRESLNAIHPRGSELIQLTFTDLDPNAAMAGLRAVVNSYEQIYGERSEEGGAQRLEVLERRVSSLTAELEATKKSINTIAEEFGSASLAPMYDFKLQEVQKLEAELKQAQLARALAEAAARNGGSATQPAGGAQAALATQPAGGAEPPAVHRTPEMIALVDPVMRSYLARQQNWADEVARLERRGGANHPTAIDARASLAAAGRLVAQRVEFFAEAEAAGVLVLPGTQAAPAVARESLESLIDRERRIEALHRAARTELIDLGKKNLLIEQKQAEAKTVAQRLEETKARIEQLNIESSVGGRLEIISRGNRPLGPHNDKRKAIAAVGGFGGAGLGIGVFLLLGLANRRLRFIDDARSSLKSRMPILGILPELPSSLEDAEQARLAGQCVHHIRATLQSGRGAGPNKVLAITSPSPGSGKTSLTAALGLSFAASGAKTLLIDADTVGGGLTSKMNLVIRRRIGQILRREGLVNDAQLAAALKRSGESSQRIGEALVELGFVSAADIEHAVSVQRESVVGLLDVLAGEPLSECVTGTGLPGLFILPLGGAAAHHAPQLSPAAMRRIFNEARAEYDTVLVDTGPILGSLEATIAAPESDQVILVLSRGDHRPLVERAIEVLFSCGAGVAGAVFNRARHQDVLNSSYSSGISIRSIRRPAGAGPEAPERALALGPIASAAQRTTEAAASRRHHD